MSINVWLDPTIVGVYLVATLIFGLYVSCRKNGGSNTTVKSYFLADARMAWWSVAASYFGSNIGAEHFVGLAGAGASTGYVMIAYEWLVTPTIILAAWFYMPVYMASQCLTLPEFLGKRHASQAVRVYLAVLSLVIYTVTKISTTIYAGVVFLQFAFEWPLWVCIIALLLTAAIYTIVGGLSAVMYVDTLQAVVMTLGGVAMAILAFAQVGWLPGLLESHPEPEILTIWRPLDSEFPWLGIVLQATFGCVWYWANDQVTMQRMLASRSLTDAKIAAIVTSWLKIAPFFVMMLPGVISRVLYPEVVACEADTCVEQCGNQKGCSNVAYPLLVTRLAPIGLKGVMLAVMVSAILSSLTSILNSSATLFALDIWQVVRPQASEREILIAGRVTAGVMCLVALGWMPIMTQSLGAKIFEYIVIAQAYLASLLGPVFFISTIWPRANKYGTLATLVSGHVVGITKLGLEMAQVDHPLARLNVFWTSCGLLVFNSVVMVIVSLVTPASSHCLNGLTWWTRGATDRDLSETSKSKWLVNANAALAMVVMIALCVIFG